MRRGALPWLLVFVGLFWMVARRGGGSAGSSSGGGVRGGVDALARGIAQAEGFNVAGSLPQRANNPGAITDSGFPGDTGQRMGAGITVFATASAGWEALRAKLARIRSGGSTSYSLNMTIRQMASRWTGNDNPDAWANTVARSVGVSADTPLSRVI